MSTAADDPHDDDAEEQERVRVCPECSEIVSYHVRDCPACGHHDPLLEFPALGAGSRTCADCGSEMLHSLLFCPKCGAERDALSHHPLPESPESESETQSESKTQAESDRQDARSNTLFAWALALLGPLAMLAAVFSVFL